MRRFGTVALAVALSALAACSTAPSPTTSTLAPIVSPAAGLAISVEVAVAGLSAPVDVTNAGDGSGRLFVVEQAGRIRVIRDGRVLAVPFLDIVGRVASGGERGLLGLAFHPDYPTDPRFFVDYTDLDGNTVVSSFRVDPADPDRADPASETVLLHVTQPFANHNGGAVEFGPDGRLYIALGDGGSRATRRGMAESSTPCWPRSCGSVSIPTGPGGCTRSRPTTRS